MQIINKVDRYCKKNIKSSLTSLNRELDIVKKNIWQLQDAKSKFSQLVENAMSSEPQFVTKHGNNAVVILSFEDYQRITKPKTDLVTFLRNSPLMGIELNISRNGELPRDIEL